jgi:hypothetical protein
LPHPSSLPAIFQQFCHGLLRNEKSGCFCGYALISLWALLLCSGIGALAQSTTPTLKANPPFSIRATHLLGFPNTKNNCNGTLSVKDDALRFEQDAKPAAEVEIASVQGVFLGSESKQVGGTPAKIGKAAAPFGSGRVVSLFSHKKYDTLTVEYVDADGGVHGAIFQVREGQAKHVRKELVTRGVSPSLHDDRSAEPSTAEAYEKQ